jgi:hypothetical protein
VHRLTHLALISVGRRGVDVPVPRVERGADCVPGLVRGRLEDPETERRDLDPVVESEGFHGSPWVVSR